MNESGRLGLGAAVTEDGKSTKPSKAAPEAPLASDGLVTWSLVGNQKQESIKWTIHEDDDIRTVEGNFGQEDKHKPVDLEDFQDGGKYRSIVKIQSRWGDEKTGKWTMGTGWLVREDILITAGHNVFSATHKCQASCIRCWIGYRGHSLTKDSSVQHRSALNVVTTESWLGQHSDRERRDLALIQVDTAFAGNLRLFRYIDTPAAKANGSIVVVGYPGDKSPEALAGETGSWMCEARQKANYDHDSSANHMIEYNMDTYGGQSGAPILFSDHNGTVVIGTHCYGATGGSVSSGSPIGGEHGNNYDEFIKLVEPSKRDEPHRLGGFQPKFANPESQPGSHYRGIIRDSSPDDFWDMLEAVLGVGLYPSRERTTLGPVGWLMATIAGGMIGVLSETAGTADQGGFILPNGKSKRACIHRAQLAESVLQCVIQLEPSQERERIMSSMQKVWSDHPSWLPLEPLGEEHLQAQLSPIFNDFGFRLAVSQWQRGVNVNPRAKPVDRELLKLTGHGPTVRSRRGDVLLAFLSGARTRFVHNADDMTVESRGLWLSDMLESALRAAKPIVSEAASKAVSRTVHAMGVGHEDAGLVPAQDQIDVEMDRILKRAVVAETALQALEDMELRELRALRVVPGGTEERESALDRLMTILQQMGPRATLIAESTMARLFTPIAHRLWKQSHQDDHHAVPGSAVADPDEVPGTPNENGNTPPPAHSPTAVPESKHV